MISDMNMNEEFLMERGKELGRKTYRRDKIRKVIKEAVMQRR